MNDLTGVKVGFFGTPDFALKFLTLLLNYSSWEEKRVINLSKNKL